VPALASALNQNQSTDARAEAPLRRLRRGLRYMKPKRTILCVDDNEQGLSIRKLILETHGYRVVACCNAADAMERFQRGGIDLLLTDLIMPGGLDGSELVSRVKALSPETPAILYSGEVRAYERETKADLFLPKGTHAAAELLERIRLLLVRKRGPKRNQSPDSRVQLAV
jgi:two-component system, OmpR family, response regulator CpxR